LSLVFSNNPFFHLCTHKPLCPCNCSVQLQTLRVQDFTFSKSTDIFLLRTFSETITFDVTVCSLVIF